MIIVHLVVDYHPLLGDNTAMLRRHLIDRLLDGLADTPAVLSTAPAKPGKAHWCNQPNWRDKTASTSPSMIPAFWRLPSATPTDSLPTEHAVTLDEVQHVPEIFPVIKAAMTESASRGNFC